MKFNGITLVSDDVKRLGKFYESVLQVELEGNDKFILITLAGVQLGLWAREEMENLSPGSTKNAGIGGCLIEFETTDFDRDYERLKAMDVNLIKEPTTQSWGRKSVWFRDPDGNIVNFFMLV
jgi:catechol 2,3-dioxygenase-like lactoylglutathione lyase family enzyme